VETRRELVILITLGHAFAIVKNQERPAKIFREATLDSRPVIIRYSIQKRVRQRDLTCATARPGIITGHGSRHSGGAAQANGVRLAGMSANASHWHNRVRVSGG
jgi:hypothetical protein